MIPSKTPILVTGAARSGTSMIARLLIESGAWGGTTEPADDENKFGFFENRLIRDGVMKTMLYMFKSDPVGISILPDKDINPQPYVGLHAVISRCLHNDGYKELPDGRKWLYKDTKLLLLWQIWNITYPDAIWVLVRRNREDIIKSCCKTSFMNSPRFGKRDYAFWSDLVDEYLIRMDILKASVNNCVEVDSDDIINGDLTSIKVAIEKAGLEWNEDEMKSRIHPEVWDTPIDSKAK